MRKKIEMEREPYASTIGSLMYAMVFPTPDIVHALKVVSNFLSNLSKEHWDAIKWTIMYIGGICLCFCTGKPLLDGNIDAYMVDEVDSRKSTLGFMMVFHCGFVSWKSRLQEFVSLSYTKQSILL